MNARPALRGLAERALLASGVAALTRRRRADDVLILAWHDVVDTRSPVGDASLHLPLADFRRQLDAITRTHDVVPLADVFTRTAPRRRPRAVLTFDDAYLGALSSGIGELVRRGLPATIFVAPAILGTQPWWDRHADPVRGALPAPMRDHALRALAGDAAAIDAAFPLPSPAFRAPLPDDARIATDRELASAARHDGITLASHSWSHVNLAALPPDRLTTELERPLEWLRARFDNVVPWLSYPYGLHSPAARAAAARAGYTAALRVDGGWLRDHAVEPGHFAGDADARYALPRVNVPAGMSLAGFRIRGAGLLAR